MKNPIKQVGLVLAAALVMAVGTTAQAQQTNPYFTGDGGKGIRLAVLEPVGKGFSDDKWMLSLVQGSISGDFNKYSSMTIIDRQNLEKVLGEWEQSMSGNYSDEDRAKIGNLANASHILTGNITKTAKSFIIEFYVTDVQSGVRKASYSPKPVSLLALENLSAIKEASADLLRQLGVNLTSAGLGELKQVENTAKIQAETMLARGISAQKQGTEVAALSYFFQAAILDPSLVEAANRSSVMAANISSGNIGADARNDIAWRKAWITRLTEAEKYFDNLNKTVSMPYTLCYSDEIIQGDINYQNETMSLTIKTYLYGSNGIMAWTLSVERALQALCDGLEATKRNSAWGLNNWPTQRVTDLNPFTTQRKTFAIVTELVNSRYQVIGRQEFQVGYYWEYNMHGRIGIRVSSDVRTDVSFTNVKADDITDNLTIQFASVNGEAAETAAQNGVLQIKAMPKREFDANSVFVYVQGEIREYKGTDKNLVIPNAIWDNPVISIGKGVFGSKSLTGVNIPNSIISIGNEAFANNQLTSVIIPNSVTSIGDRTFINNTLDNVTIGENVTLGQNAFGRGFEEFYQNSGRMAGIYYHSNACSNVWGTNIIHCPEMVFVQGGKFTMGCTAKQSSDCNDDEKPAHSVIISNFHISKHEVTQQLWFEIMGSNPSIFRGDFLPVTRINWEDIQKFISKLNSLTGKKYRLPTEAEWEYAVRGGNKSKGYMYSGSNTISDVAWYGINSDGKPHPVGTKQSNELGIYDMSGNVLELVSDWHGDYGSSAQTNPIGNNSGSFRVSRGGSWNHNAKGCRVSYRGTYAPTYRDNNIGFRLALDP